MIIAISNNNHPMAQESFVIHNLINTIDRMSIFNEMERRLSFMNVNEKFLYGDLSGAIDDFIDNLYDCDGVLAFTVNNNRIVLNINGCYFVIAHQPSHKRNMTDFFISRYDDPREAYERYIQY